MCGPVPGRARRRASGAYEWAQKKKKEQPGLGSVYGGPWARRGEPKLNKYLLHPVCIKGLHTWLWRQSDIKQGGAARASSSGHARTFFYDLLYLATKKKKKKKIPPVVVSALFSVFLQKRSFRPFLGSSCRSRGVFLAPVRAKRSHSGQADRCNWLSSDSVHTRQSNI